VLVLKERLDREKAGLYTLTIRYNPSLNYSSLLFILTIKYNPYLHYSSLLFKSYSPSGTNCPLHYSSLLFKSHSPSSTTRPWIIHPYFSNHTHHQVQTVPALFIHTVKKG
jgi:hypothetical protein